MDDVDLERKDAPPRTVEVTAELDVRIQRVLARVKEQAIWKLITDPKADPGLVRRIAREVYLEIAWYQPDTIEATICTIAQLPRAIPAKLIRAMLQHQSEEWDHGEMALRDYVALGGSEEFARTSRPSPSAYAVASYWRNLAHKRDPVAYLGALYLFEGLTPLVTGLAKPFLRAKGLAAGMEFVEFHSTEDIQHQRMVRGIIRRVLAMFPERRDSLIHGLDCFEHIYPIPCWGAAYERALAGGAEILYQGGYPPDGLHSMVERVLRPVAR